MRLVPNAAIGVARAAQDLDRRFKTLHQEALVIYAAAKKLKDLKKVLTQVDARLNQIGQPAYSRPIRLLRP